MAYIHQIECISPLGENLACTVEAMSKGLTAIQYIDSVLPQGFYGAQIPHVQIMEGYTRLESLMIQCLEKIKQEDISSERTLLLVSTTKGNIRDLASNFESAKLFTLAHKVAQYFRMVHEPLVISQACVSGIMSVAIAKRLVDGGLYDTVYLVAGDELTAFVASGFNSFQAMSPEPCKPYDADRAGVSLGEAVAALRMNKEKSSVKVIGEASINDANHISGPSRTGEGLKRSIELALQEAQVEPSKIDFISAHGTATPYNDEMESIAFERVGMKHVPVNSLKGYFGHTLGASGLLETVVCLKGFEQNTLWGTLGFSKLGVSQAIHIIKEAQKASVQYFCKTASGFGGSNSAVIFKIDQ